MLNNGNSTILLMNNNPNVSTLVKFFGFDDTYDSQQSYKENQKIDKEKLSMFYDDLT